MANRYELPDGRDIQIESCIEQKELTYDSSKGQEPTLPAEVLEQRRMIENLRDFMGL